jgi:1,4-dihydroxy-2-naphthoate octaprenyltransferase
MFKHYIKAARLRTLPLSVSGIIIGSALAWYEDYKNYQIFVFAILTTVGFQIISNFANDYGDGIKGTDNIDRIGPKRAIQSGVISPKQMKNAIIITLIITLIFALILIYLSFGFNNLNYSIIFLLLGIISIVAAIKYTVGKKAYGYSGFGDLFVFMFFGLLSTIGTYFLYTKNIDLKIIYPAISVGLLSVAVLNLNNMRDIKNDEKSNKNTFAVIIGKKNAKIYHAMLLTLSLVSIIVFSCNFTNKLSSYIYLIAYIPLSLHLLKVINTNNEKDYDPELKKVAISTFFFSVLFAIGLFI